MITAYFDVQPKKAPAHPSPAPPRPPSSSRRMPRVAKSLPKPSEAATTSVLAKFEPLAAERGVPRAAEAPGRQQWQGLSEAEMKDDELAEWDGAFMEEDDEDAANDDDDDVSEPDFEVDSLETDAASACELSSSVEELAPSLKAVFGARRQRRAPQQRAVYAGPLLCCDDDEDDFDI